MTAASDLAARLARLEDLRAIEATKAAYCEALDSGYDLEALDRVLADDARWLADGFGDLRGRTAIRAFFADLACEVVKVRHYATAPRIELDGDRATAGWQMLCLCTRRHRDDPDRTFPVLEFGSYADRLTRFDDRWLFTEIAVTVEHGGKI